ncbi:MAG: hypothetical protein KF884_07915 [Fimbriimonadaceae bacterium]|nr:hypothetical protein [Fimbriimonadaceae bacterium]QYK57476.1 MAG: hypothetical protein KF884_07915 [Fimbriimonadaceae bacterium]
MRLAAIVLAVLAVAGVAFQIFRTGPSDQEAITQAVADAVRASREGQPGGVLEHLSRSLTYNDVPVSERGELAKFIRDSRPQVVFDSTRALIEGDRAVIQTGAQIDLRLGPVPLSQRIDKVKIVLGKETGFRFLVVPTPKWRIQNIEVEGIGVSALEY